ncbi:PucR family transcriptional regulator [Rhodococcus sp. T2V]|uniref:PucR family transcriptional regulator n=1 Tax=Rhodococcus sp. T2V TaxID=3034164 RepID=UPI0023E0EB62|nr:PucR family transcriptional regulator [Rhodococcus sp. T2V]MDF3306224.1 PucR family transcriptional regulator [Rhodococcus sp. T2V]
MDFTVADALELDLLKKAGARVLTGGDNLDREVRWVHSSEISDIARFLRGGELLLTAGLGMGNTAALQQVFVRAVARAGAAALVIEESGRMFDRVPDAVIQEGATCGLPIVALSQEVPFAGVSAQVHEILTNIRLSALTREREVESTFSELLLMGADSLAIVQTLSRLTGGAVVLENIVNRVTAYVGDLNGVEIEEWERHARGLHSDDAECVRRPVLMRGQPWGWIHVLLGPSTDRDGVVFAVERGAAAVAISLLTDRSREARDDQRSTSLITRLLLGDLTGIEFVEQASRLGYQLGSGRIVVAIANKDHRDDTSTGTRIPRHDDVAVISADLGEYTVAVTSAKTDRENLLGYLGNAAQGGGVSRAVAAQMLPVAVAQAKSAAAVARSLPNSPILDFDDLGVERLLVALAQGPELASYVEDEIGPLLTKDARSSAPLLPTLRAFLEVDGRKTEAAESLFIQRRTLYNRLTRISEILGKSLDDAATRQSLLLAVKGLDLLEGSSVVSRRTPPR